MRKEEDTWKKGGNGWLRERREEYFKMHNPTMKEFFVGATKFPWMRASEGEERKQMSFSSSL